MTKHIFKRATQTGAKLLFSILALLLVLTGCNVPTPPQEELPTGTEQPTEAPTEQPTEEPTELPTELPTEQETQPEPVEARYDIFLSLLEKSYTEKQEFVAETYVQDVYNWWYSLNVTIEKGELYLGNNLYAINYVDTFSFEFGNGLLSDADDNMRIVLDRLKNQNGYYVLQHETYVKYGQKVVLVEVNNAIYFLAMFEIDGNVYCMRVHAVCFE